MPRSGSPGVATIGAIAVEVDPVDAAGVVGARVGAHEPRRGASSVGTSGRRAAIHATVASSTSTMPAFAEHSVAMLASVARSSIESDGEARARRTP